MTNGSSSSNNNNNNSGQDRDLEQPLLRSRTPTPKPPPRHAFLLSPNHRDEIDEPNPDDLILEQLPQQQQQQQQQQPPPYHASTSDLTDVRDIDDESTMLPIMGQPFATSAKFWYRLLPGSLLIGALSGFSVAAFLWTTQKCMSLWLSFEKDSNHLFLFHMHGASPGLLLLFIPSMGGLVSGLCFLLPKAPRLGACKTFLHNAVDLQANPWESSFVIFSSLVVLATGGPLGPELAIGAIGGGLGRMVGTVDPKTSALWVQAGLSGSLGSLFSSPLLGVLLIHELNGGRGRTTTMPFRHPLTTSIDGTTSNNRETGQTLTTPFEYDSFLERMVASGASAVMTSLVLNHTIFQGLFFWQNHENAVYSLRNDDFDAWHWALAIPMGLLGGLVASVVIATTCTCRTIRIRASESFRLPYGGQVLLFCTLAGLFHGLLGFYRSPTTDFGISFVKRAMDSIQSDDNDTTPVSFLLMALVQGLGVSVCIGFGLVGGMFVPMAFVGACIGLAVTSSIFPLSLAVPCCMASCVGATCPTPLTIVLATCLLFNLTGEQMTSVWIATMVAQTLVGGFGILPRLLGIPIMSWLESEEQQSQQLDPQGTDEADDMYIQPQPSLSDEEILRGVRSAIFGPAS